MSTWQERAKARMTALGVTQDDLIETLGVKTRGAVGHYLTDRRGLGVAQALALAKRLDMTMDELFGDEQLSAVGSPKEESLKAEENATEYQPSGMCSVPVVDVSLSAGSGTHADLEEVVGHMPLPIDLLYDAGIAPEIAKIVHVKGDSMDDTFIDGDKILVNANSKRLISGKIFAFEFDGNLRVKRFMKKMDGTWRVVSDNEDKNLYPDEIVSPANVDSLRIIGEVVGLVFRKM